MKVCRICELPRPFSEFQKAKKNKDSLDSRGRSCKSAAEMERRKDPAKRESQLEAGRRWYNNHRETGIAASKRWIANNHEHVLERKRKYRAEHKEWVKNNPLKWYVYQTNKKRRQHGGKGVTPEEWVDLCEQFDNRCVDCGRGNVELTQDHVLPTSKGGKHEIGNLQPLCRSCNSRKNTKTIDYRVTFAARFGE